MARSPAFAAGESSRSCHGRDQFFDVPASPYRFRYTKGMSAADLIASRRRELGLSQGQLAELTATSREPVSYTHLLSNVRSSITSATGNETGSYLARCTASPGISA